MNFHLIGVRPDANYFNYATECESNRQIVMDFIGGHMTQGVPPNSYAHAMAASIAFDCEEVDSFGDFVDATSFSEINGRLMMMIELVFVGAYKILVNLIPHKTNGVPNDGYIVKMLDAHIAMRKDYALYLRIYADTFLNKAISPSDYQYERNESLSDDELLYYNEIQEILKSINAQMSKHEIDHCKGIVI